MTDVLSTAIDADAVVADLTLEQKASLGGGSAFWRTAEAPGVPSFVLTDGPHGVRYQSQAADHLGMGKSDPATCFPPATGLAQSWDADLAARVGAALADESQAAGVSVLLGPGINIKRDPRCGRNFEYFSEDPLLTGVLGAAWVNGLQSGGVGASLKHFAVNNQEHDRMRSSSDVDERPLHEIYLRAFERVVRDARPWTVMCSYNRINGVSASENRWLLTEVLRDEWGFEGAVVSDWGAVSDRVAAAAAGLDLQMPGPTDEDDAAVVAAVESGTLDEADVTRAARAVARTALLAEAGRREVTVDVDAHHALAREAAARSIVLLKNDGGLLPLEAGRSLAVIGAFATEPRYQGGGSSHVSATRVDIPLDEIRAVAGGDVTHAAGFTTDGSGDPAALRAEAVEAARGADAAVLFLGLSDGQESEGFDREHLDLPADQLDVLEAVAAVQPRTVVVLSSGGVLQLSPVVASATAILNGALLGQAGGGAIADVLFGAVNPSGRTAETIPLRLQDAPSYPFFPGEYSHVRYGEGVFVGYRGYDIRDQAVLYPFGHGLSYTTFAYEELKLVVDGEDVEATVTVRNTGTRAGREIVQIYASVAGSAVARAKRELVGFGAVELEPGAARELTVRIEHRDLAYWSVPLGQWVVEPGSYTLAAGASSRDIRLEESIELAGDSVFVPFDLESTFGELMGHPIAGPAIASAMPWVSGDVASADMGIDDSMGVEIIKVVADIPIGRLLKTFGAGDAQALAGVQALIDGINAQAAAQ